MRKMIPLNEYCSSVRDGTHDSPKPTEEGKYLITSRHLNNGEIDFSNAYKISLDDFEKINKRSKVERWDLLMSMIGTIGRLYVVKEEPDYAIKNLALFKIGDEWRAKYLYYYLSSQPVQDYFEAVANGTSQHFVGLGYLRKFKIPDWDTNTLQIIKVLNNYDCLIENNKKRINLLEQMAEELYKEWFVRFRFPDYQKVKFKDSKLGKIPESFETINVDKVLDYFVGGGWGNDDFSDEFPIDAYVIRGADFPEISKSDVSTCPYRFHKFSNYKPRKLKENDIVFEISGGTQEQPVGRVVLVTKGILDQLDDKAICASFCKLLRVNGSAMPLYFYYWLKYLYDTRIIEQFQLQSTGIINFKFEYFLRKGPVLLPPYSLMEDFDRRIKLIRDEIDSLAKSNSNLIKQRDSLLPRLMSGKLSVEGKEIV